MKTEAPATYEEAGALLSACARQGSPVRFIGGSTKLAWGNAVPAPQLELSTTELADVVEHNTGDFTAVVQAGAPFAAAQKVFAGADQMFALDPPAVEDGATFGGIVASGDSGPLRHRFNAV